MEGSALRRVAACLLVVGVAAAGAPACSSASETEVAGDDAGRTRRGADASSTGEDPASDPEGQTGPSDEGDDGAVVDPVDEPDADLVDDAAEDAAPVTAADAGNGNSADGGTKTTTNACTGKANGFAYDPAHPAARCCNQAPVDTSKSGNCGGCGITCPTGFTCGAVSTGHWGCHCSTNAQCAAAGYGAGATCYNDGTRTFCNCQCPGGALSCGAQCGGGATCHDVPGQNYCSYP